MFDARRGSHWNPNYRIVLLSASWMIVAGIPTCSVGCGPNDHRHIVHSRPFELRLRFHFLEGRQTRAVQLNFDQMIATRSFKWTEMKCSAYHTAVGVLTTTINANNQWNFAIALQDLSPVKTCSELSWTSISELQWWAATIRIHVFESELRCSFGDRTYCKLCLFLLLKNISTSTMKFMGEHGDMTDFFCWISWKILTNLYSSFSFRLSPLDRLMLLPVVIMQALRHSWAQ